LVCLSKGSLAPSRPIRPTIVSKNHQIYHRGTLVKAGCLLGNCPGVHRVRYNGDVLYNILLHEHVLVNANNMMCESLHPSNPVALLYKMMLRPSNQTRTKKKLNSFLKSRRHNS
jgi:hypothetical protein